MHTAIIDRMSEWSEQLVIQFAKSARARREELGLKVQDVADKTAELGHPISRTAITDYELGRRKDRLMLGDAIILAEALKTTLGLLLYPAYPDGEVERVPGKHIDARTANRALSVEIPGLTSDHEITLNRDMTLPLALLVVSEGLHEGRQDLYRYMGQFVKAVKADDIDEARGFDKLVDVQRENVRKAIEKVRSLGGVVDDG